MRARHLIAATAALGVGVAGASLWLNEAVGEAPASPAAAAGQLRPAASFSNIADQRARSVALFAEAGKVLQHPRCVNCHPVGDRPFQTDRMQPHQPVVVRGKDGHCAPGMTCNTCHGAANFDPARVPGDPHWHLAPASMAWEGKTLGYICEQLKDPARNGNKSMAEILRHVATDSLVRWGWSPGPGRTPAPGTNAEFAALLNAWAETGAYCPAP
jgi:hypothetical protein